MPGGGLGNLTRMKPQLLTREISAVARNGRQLSIAWAGGKMGIGPRKRLCLGLGLGLMMGLLLPSRGAAPPFDCFATSDLTRVFEDGYGQPGRRLTNITVFGLRNEIVSAQCVVLAREDLEGLTLSLGPLQQAEGSAVIPGDNLSWSFVGSILIQTNTPKLQKQDLIRPAPAWFPDYLSDERQCSVRKGSYKAVYLTLQIPRDAQAGEYRTAVTITVGAATASLPLILKVYPLTLPDQRHLMVTEWFSTSQFRKHHDVEPSDEVRFFQMLKVYAENMAAHRQNVFRLDLDLVKCTRSADGKLRFDFSRFDRWAQVFWDTGGMDLIETGFIARFGEGGWSSSDIVLREFSVRDEPTGRRTALAGEEYLPQFLPVLVTHLREKGWLAKTVFHICDEPSDHNVMAWRRASDFLHRYAPELRRLDAIETPHCFGALEIWVPKLDHLATWHNVFEEAQRQGNELWFYTVGIFQNGSLPNKTVDVPLIETRLMHWLNFRFGLKGYLHWGFNAWTDDPIRAPGEHRGDGWHVYPKRDGLLNSVRWEQVRNGLQDYECLWLLQTRIAQIKATLSERVAALIEPSRRGVEIASQVIESYHDYTKDPDVLYAARREAIEETLALDQSPRVLFQTNPLEHSALAKGCSIDVFGWAEPGTRIRINGEPVPVASDGLFLNQLPPSSEGKILLEAQGQGGKKVLVRKFKLLD
jgi:hypothetical protein